MGCYIHAFVEIMDDGDDDLTRFFAQLELVQDYDLFALMAGVRNENNVTPVAEPKGLPHNLSYEVEKAVRQVTDSHSHSWLYLNELKLVQQRYTAIPVERLPHLNSIIALMEAMEEYAGGTRLVFWFVG